MNWTSLHLFCGMGGDALGFRRAGFDVLAGLDGNEEACQDFEALVGAPAHQVDLGELLPGQLRELVGERRPDVLVLSPPCKGNSPCLGEEAASSAKYQKLNSLGERGLWVALEAWGSPPALVMLENVENVQRRSRRWLDAIIAMLTAYGYAVRETTHDCGEIGGLAQHRRRYLLAARHKQQCPEFLYQPPLQRVRGVGEVLSQLPVPTLSGSQAGPMHDLGKLAAITWVRLALVPPGGDHRDLPERLRMEEDRIIVPRLDCIPRAGAYGVRGAGDPSYTVLAHACHDNSPVTFADPRVRYCAPQSECSRYPGSIGVTRWSDPSATVIGNATPHNGPWQVADPRWAVATHAVEPGDPPVLRGPLLDVSNNRRFVRLVIRATDGTWHRPMTPLELALLQGFPAKIDGDWLQLSGRSKARWKQRIGNAIPVPTAQAIAESCARSLQAAKDGGLLLSGEPVWVEKRSIESNSPSQGDARGAQ